LTEETPQEAAQMPQQTQTPREMQRPRVTQTSREMQPPQKAQMPQEAGTKKVSLEVSLQMSSRFPRQEVPQELTRHWPQDLTY
jgi:hypothetical protein